jgi:hypothetical protein
MPSGAVATITPVPSPPEFAHEAERQCARLLDFFGVRWEYEPHTFPLVVDELGRVREAFTPDFWLPDLGLYVEVTTQRPDLMRRKLRKLRLLAEHRRDVRVKLLDGRDVRHLSRVHGLAPAA